MVSFNRNIANDEQFPIEPQSHDEGCRLTCSAHSFQRSQVWLAEVNVAWDQLLATVSDLHVSPTCYLRRSTNVIFTQSDLPRIVISILNRFQLVIGMFESQAEALDGNESFEKRLIRIRESSERDLARLRKLVRDSSFQIRLTFRIAELAEQLEAFSRRIFQ